MADFDLKYDIVYSILAHEEPECLKNQIENIILHNFNYKIAIIVHLNEYLIDNFFTNINNVFINNSYYNKKLYHHTILKGHIDNFLFFREKKIKFLYYVPLSSNCMFIKQMNIPSNYFFLNKIYTEKFSIKDNETGWHWGKILKNTEIVNILKKKKVPMRIGYHEGRIIFYELFNKICNFIIDNNFFENIVNECVFEEFLLPSLEAYFNDNNNCITYLKLFKERINKNDVINQQNINNLLKVSKVFIIKRIPRKMNDEKRILINKITNINHKKNGYFENNNDIININYYNFATEKQLNMYYKIIVDRINYNSFTTLNFKNTKSNFDFDSSNDLWIEKRFNNIQADSFEIIKWKRKGKKKKIAIILKGATGMINNWGVKNFDNCYKSFKENILKYFKIINYEVDIYIHTYESNNKNKIINLLNPKKYIFEKFNNKSNQLNSLKEALKLIDNYDYDSYIITRIDLIYKKSIQYFNINFSESYYLFNHPNNTKSDVFFIISGNNFDSFKKYILQLNASSAGLHNFNFPFKIKSVCKNKYYSDTDYSKYFILNSNPIYKLDRIRRWGFKNENDAIEECKKQNKYQKKLALLLYGISYDENHRYYTNKKIVIDYKNSLDNYKKYIMAYFEKNNFEIDIFICTNENKKKPNIIDDYKPKGCLFIKDNCSEMKKYYQNNLQEILDIKKNRKHQHHERYYYTNIKKLKVLELCKDYSKKNKVKYDNIILTRFDLNFNIDFNEAKINYGMFNIISMLEKPDIIDDNFYLFPQNSIDDFIKILKNNLCEWGHTYKKYFEEIFDLNFIYNENKNIKYLSFYNIVRKL